MFVTDFEYANHRLSEFGFIIGSITTNTGTETINIGCDLTFTTVKNNHTSAHSSTSSVYDDVYKTEFEIIKYDCANGDYNDIYLSTFEIRKIIKWLNRRTNHKFKPLNVDQDDSIHYYGSFNVNIITIGGNAVGLKLSFTSTTPYALDEPIVTRHMLLNETDTIRLCGDTDEECTIYPKIEIRCFADGDLTITNHTTQNVIDIKNCKNGEVITMDGTYSILFSNFEDTEHTTLPNDFNYTYFDIEIDEDITENIYSSTLPCEIKVCYMPTRKVGMY